VLVDMAVIVASVAEQGNAAELVQGGAFTLPLHCFFTVHCSQHSSSAFTQNQLATNCTCAEAMNISAPLGFKTNAEPNVPNFTPRISAAHPLQS
jgi:hypothetical protein